MESTVVPSLPAAPASLPLKNEAWSWGEGLYSLLNSQAWSYDAVSVLGFMQHTRIYAVYQDNSCVADCAPEQMPRQPSAAKNQVMQFSQVHLSILTKSITAPMNSIRLHPTFPAVETVNWSPRLK